MTKPLDEVGAVREGVSRHASAARFGVSISSAIRWAKLAEETGSVKAKPMGGDRHSKLLEHRDFLLDLVRAEPDLTLTEIRGRLAQRRIIVGHARVWRFFAREKISFKKSRMPPSRTMRRWITWSNPPPYSPASQRRTLTRDLHFPALPLYSVPVLFFLMVKTLADCGPLAAFSCP
jgi:transposase